MNEKVKKIMEKINENPDLYTKGMAIFQEAGPTDEKVNKVVALINENGVDITKEEAVQILKKIAADGLESVIGGMVAASNDFGGLENVILEEGRALADGTILRAGTVLRAGTLLRDGIVLAKEFRFEGGKVIIERALLRRDPLKGVTGGANLCDNESQDGWFYDEKNEREGLFFPPEDYNNGARARAKSEGIFGKESHSGILGNGQSNGQCPGGIPTT